MASNGPATVCSAALCILGLKWTVKVTVTYFRLMTTMQAQMMRTGSVLSVTLKSAMGCGTFTDTVSVTKDKLVVALWCFDDAASKYFPWARGDDSSKRESITISE